jgi:hypothetical protein
MGQSCAVRSVDELARCYWEYWRLATSSVVAERDRADEYLWAPEEVTELVRERAEDQVDVLIAIADAAPSDDALGHLGAGPIENMIHPRTPDYVIDQIEVAAETNPNFRTALRFADFDDDRISPEVRARLRRFGEML